MKMTAFIIPLNRSSLARSLVLVIGFVGMLITSGCISVAESLAEAPYEKAMRQGRMLPSEYKKEQESIRQAVEPGR